MTALAGELTFDATFGYLPSLLKALHVSVESQIEVFSKTSIQAMRIEPSTPRVLYFNDSVVVGWVRGGFIEVAAQDSSGPVEYYVLQQRPDERLTARQDCVRCHKDSALLFRSSSAGVTGIVSSEADVDGRTPFNKLWGGWFVTGNLSSAAHAGNAALEHSERRELSPVFDPRGSLANTSDVAALLVFGHQMRIMNLLAHPENVNDLADALLFSDDAPLPGPVDSHSSFAEMFTAAGPRDRHGRSLREFSASGQRLMRYRCSYMIYSAAFEGLPPVVKEGVYRRLWAILSGAVARPQLSFEDRRAIVAILLETKPQLPPWFRPL